MLRVSENELEQFAQSCVLSWKSVCLPTETLINLGISVILFSLQRVLDMGYLLVYGEVPNKCVIKKVAADGTLTQVATMTIVKGRSTLDCDPTTSESL